MRTAIVSDLHLGSATSADLLRDRDVRAALAPVLAEADRAVLLGDVLELRDRPLSRVLELAGPVLEWIGANLGGDEVVLVAGNHDHHLVVPWLERRALSGAAELGLAQRIEPGEGPLRTLAERLAPARLAISYPGVWVRDDVYAMHGQQLDRHLTIPSLERLAVGVVERLLGLQSLAAGAAEEPAEPLEYERVQTPVYEFLYALAQADADQGPASAGPSIRVWQMLSGGHTRTARLRGWLLGSVALPGAVGVANRLGIGPVSPDLSAEAIAAAGVKAMATVVERLGIDAAHVVFGHTHRRGPLPGDDLDLWRAGDAMLWNAGSWVYSPSLVGARASRSPYWPGTAILVDERGGPPRPVELLSGWSRAELARATAG